jgi:hypothetical protein
MKFESDIDIDFKNREDILKVIKHTPAGIIRDGKLIKHNTGVFVTDIPKDALTGTATIHYKDAEQRGYVKLDFLNVHVYDQVKSEQHLIELMDTPPKWDKLYNRDFCEQLIHINNHYDTLLKMPDPVDSITRLAMFLAIIRPSKRHLIGLPWKEVSKTIWEKDDDEGYAFKKAHAISYAHLVVVHMNLLLSANKSD